MDKHQDSPAVAVPSWEAMEQASAQEAVQEWTCDSDCHPTALAEWNYVTQGPVQFTKQACT